MAAPMERKLSARSIVKGISAFIMYRFPFLSALTLTMLCAEREQAHKSEGFPVVYIYIHIAVMFVCGTMMSVGSQRSLFAVITAVAMGVFTTITQTQQKNTSKLWLTARIASHDVGTIGVFLVIASRAAENLGKRYRLQFLFPYGKNFMSIFLIITSVQLYRSPEERRAFLATFPHAHSAMVIMGLALLIGGFLLSSEWQTKRVSAFMAVALLVYILTVDSNFQYWQYKGKLEYWMQMDMVLDSVTVLCTLIFMAT